MDYLRQKIQSLAFRGDYPGCIKLIDDNMRTLYEHERWPDRFFSILRIYQRCYPSLQKSENLMDRLVSRFEKNDVPTVLAELLCGSDTPVSWNAEYFKDLAVLRQSDGDCETALSYCDLAVKIDPASPGVHVVRGWILDDLNRPHDAEDMYEYAIELNESSHIAHQSLAKHCVDKNPQKALEHIERAIELAPSEGAYYDTKARILTRLGDREGAIFAYELAMSASPYTADYPYRRGELLLTAGKEVAAIAQYRKAVALDGDHVPSLLRLADLYAESQPSLALSYINAVAAQDPENKEVVLLKAKLLGRLGETEAALDEFRQLLGVEPRCHEALAGYAGAVMNDDPGVAVSYYEKAIAISPKTAAYHMGKALAHEKLGQTAQAVKEYRAAAGLDGKNVRAFGRLGALLAETKPHEALECYTKAISLEPENSLYYAEKAEILLKRPESRNEAIACLDSAVRYDPGNARLHTLLAELLDASGNVAGAVTHYRQAVNIEPDNPAAFFRLASLTLGTEPETALLHINSAISLDVDNGEYYYLKAKILNALGHDRKALEHLQQSLRTDGRNADTLSEISDMISSESPELALFYMNRAVGLLPGRPEFVFARGNLMYDMGRYPDALAQYREALRLDAKCHEALFGTARCLALNGGNALEYFDKAIALAPGNAEYHGEKAAFLALAGRLSEALASYDAALAIDGRNWKYALAKAKLLDADGQTSAAIGFYQNVLSICPECPEAVGGLGVLLANGSPREALPYLDHAIELEPGNYLYHAWKSRALLELGDNVGAAVEYQKSAAVGGETSETYFTLAQILAEKSPETALGYCLRAIGADSSVADCHFLCGNIYVTLGQTGSAIDRFRSASILDPSRHDAPEKIAEIMCARNDPRALDAVDEALESNPDCPRCLLLRVKIFDEREENADIGGLIDVLDHALKIAPGYTPAREKLIELLQRNRSFVRLALEKRKLEKGGR